MRAFNEIYFRRGRRAAESSRLVSLDSYFFPLDGIGDWNRIYGRSGFVQYQCVVPTGNAKTVLAEILDRTARRGDASFLAVLKQLGPAQGTLSFPMPGLTLALDFPFRPTLLPFLDTLDEIVAHHGGRIYLAKDSRQGRRTFEAGYPQLPLFRSVRRALDPDGRLVSNLSARLGL
jgi:FAD/FMN-containing dehydrogenase